MPKYRVTLYYHGSATYDVEAADEGKAKEAAEDFGNLESEEEFHARLNLDYEDYMVEEDKEE